MKKSLIHFTNGTKAINGINFSPGIPLKNMPHNYYLPKIEIITTHPKRMETTIVFRKQRRQIPTANHG